MDAATLLKIVNFYGRFTPNYTKIGYYARGLPWGSSRPWDFSGQHWVVTGANAGIGEAIMRTASAAGASVVAVARNAERLNGAVSALPAESAQRVMPLVADMSLQSQTDELIGRLVADGRRIDVLMNNVGVLLNEHEVTTEGREKSFVTNLLSHFQLTEGLMEAGLIAEEATIVNMSSGGMYNVPRSIKGLNTLDGERYSGKIAYGFHKRAQVALTNYWNRKYGDRGLRVYVSHPGWSKTPGVRFSLPTFWKIQNVLLRTPLQGGDTALWLAAERPEIGDEEAIWFDRKPRETHIFEHTRTPLCSVEELVDFLQRELDQGAPETPAAPAGSA